LLHEIKKLEDLGEANFHNKWLPFRGIIHDYGGTATKLRNWYWGNEKRAAFAAALRPRAEVLRLRAKIEALEEQDRTAMRQALAIMAENDRLSDYKDFMMGKGGFLTADDANVLRRERDDALRKADRVGASLNALEADWREFLAKGTFVGPLPTLMKAKPKHKTPAMKLKTKPKGSTK
jgi:hypothetical protein